VRLPISTIFTKYCKRLRFTRLLPAAPAYVPTVGSAGAGLADASKSAETLSEIAAIHKRFVSSKTELVLALIGPGR
jgi:hypothetical protein